MTLSYEFGGNDYERGNKFEYEVERGQVAFALEDCDRAELLKFMAETIDFVQYKRDFDTDLENCSIAELVFAIANEDEYEEYFEEYLTEYFENEAREQWSEEESCAKDIYAYNGVSQSDFM